MKDFFNKINWLKVFLTLLPTLLISILFVVFVSTESNYVKVKYPKEPRNNSSMVLYTKNNCDCDELINDWNSFKESNKNSGITFKHIEYSDLKYDDFFKIYKANGLSQFFVFNNKGEVVSSKAGSLTIEGMNQMLSDSLSVNEKTEEVTPKAEENTEEKSEEEPTEIK